MTKRPDDPRSPTFDRLIERTRGDEPGWRSMFDRLALALHVRNDSKRNARDPDDIAELLGVDARTLHARNTGKRNAREQTYRQLLVAVLWRFDLRELDDIAELLGVDARTIQRDLEVLRELHEPRRSEERDRKEHAAA